MTWKDYPDWYSDEDYRQWAITDDWDWHDLDACRRELSLKELGESWLHGYDTGDYSDPENRIKRARLELQALCDTPFQAKRPVDTRREKTQEYRKRKPKAPRYNPDSAMSAALLFCLIGAHS